MLTLSYMQFLMKKTPTFEQITEKNRSLYVTAIIFLRQGFSLFLPKAIASLLIET